MIPISYVSGANADDASGTVVVIDVIRAFTTAASAFAAGALAMLLVESEEQAWDLKRRFPHALLMGEIGGRPISGFDFGNSPAPFDSRRIDGAVIIQRTTHGTRGVVRATQAERILTASFAVAEATVSALAGASAVSFVITGKTEYEDGDEDAACAEYLAARLRDERPDPSPYLERVRSCSWAKRFYSGDPDFPVSDIERCCGLDRYGFAMEVERSDGLILVRPSGLLGRA